MTPPEKVLLDFEKRLEALERAQSGATEGSATDGRPEAPPHAVLPAQVPSSLTRYSREELEELVGYCERLPFANMPNQEFDGVIDCICELTTSVMERAGTLPEVTTEG